MGSVTHGGSLPDSAQKTDFYNIIDTATVSAITNADVASNAAIADTKLAQITTTNKVSVSALTDLTNIVVNLKEYTETSAAVSASAVDCDLGSVFTKTITGETTFTFTNPATTGKCSSFTLVLTNGGSATVHWPASVDWQGGTAPTLTASGKDILSFFTIDGGTTWWGFICGKDMK